MSIGVGDGGGVGVEQRRVAALPGNWAAAAMVLLYAPARWRIARSGGLRKPAEPEAWLSYLPTMRAASFSLSVQW